MGTKHSSLHLSTQGLSAPAQEEDLRASGSPGTCPELEGTPWSSPSATQMAPAALWHQQLEDTARVVHAHCLFAISLQH